MTYGDKGSGTEETLEVSDATRVIPRRKPEAVYRVLDGEAMIAVAGRSEVHVLNGVGTFVLGLVDGLRSADELVLRVMDEYEVSQAQAEADVAEFLTLLTNEGVIE